MPRIEHNTERWLRSNAELYRSKGNQQMSRNFELCADDFAALRIRAEQAEARLSKRQSRWQDDTNAILAQRND